MKNVCENNRRYFLSINHTHYTPPLKNADYTGKKRWSSAGKLDNAHKNLEKLNQASKDFDLSISGSGINPSTKANADKQVQGTEAWNTSPEEQKLSEKAKKYLASLREQYGDYDFLIADDVQNPLDIAGPSHKKYFVMLSTQEIERMANDDAYAKEVMAKVEESTNTLNQIEQQGLLGEGVRFKRLAISFDDDGNTKLFAELERMTEEQQQRLEEAMKKRAETKREQAKNPPTKRPAVPTYQELTLAIKASIQQYSFTTEKVMNLLYAGLDNGNNHNISGHAVNTQSGTSVNVEIETKLTTTTMLQETSRAARWPQEHQGHHNHPVHPVHHKIAESSHSAASPSTVRIEVASAEELLENTKNINWDNE